MASGKPKTGVHHVKDMADFDECLKEAGSKLVVIDFYATWCGPCKITAPKVEKMASDFTDVVFLKVDVDEIDDLATKYDVNCMPTFVLLKNSEKVVENLTGSNEAPLLEAILANK